MRPLAVLNVVGLTSSLLDWAPRIRGHGRAVRLAPVLPAVTCSVQASMLTGAPVREHGIVGNGWYDRETCEIRFWQRSNHLMHGEKVWQAARHRDGRFTCANLFWWHNSYASCDYIVQARPMYKADGRKIPDCHTHPSDLRDQLQAELGRFPLFRFWGPLADITSTRWIAEAAKRVHSRYEPTLTLVYLPHLDYPLQKLGPDHPDTPSHVGQIDAIVSDLIDYFGGRGVDVAIVSEYGIESARPDGAIAINRILREHGLLQVREEDGHELLDPGACQAFAVADHQIAHIYTSPQQRAHVQALCDNIPGVSRALSGGDAREGGIGHPRAGEVTLVAAPGHWFTYDYWPSDQPDRAPDFARTVDIHRKPGYDPRELFTGCSRGAVAWKLLKRKLGMRQLLDVISLDTSLVKGTHGRTDMPADLQPLLIVPPGLHVEGDTLPCEAVKQVMLDALFSRSSPPLSA